MAKLNGVEIKSLKTFRGHEGEPLAQGSVYIDGKKVGYWSQDSHGGPDEYWSDISTNIEDIITERAKRFKEGTPETYKYYGIMDDPGVFMGQLLRLIDDEKAWKALDKEGYPNVLFEINGWKCKVTGYKDLDHAKSVLESKKDPETISYICTSKQDFIIECDKNHPATERILA